MITKTTIKWRMILIKAGCNLKVIKINMGVALLQHHTIVQTKNLEVQGVIETSGEDPRVTADSIIHEAIVIEAEVVGVTEVMITIETEIEAGIGEIETRIGETNEGTVVKDTVRLVPTIVPLMKTTKERASMYL